MTKAAQESNYGEIKDKICKLAERHAIEMDKQKRHHLSEIKKVLGKTTKDPIQMQEMFRLYSQILMMTGEKLREAEENTAQIKH